MISKSNIKFMDTEVRTWLVDLLHRPSKKLRNCLKIKIWKILKDQQKWQRNCSTNTLENNIQETHNKNRNNASVINCVRCDNALLVIFFKIMYNKTIIRFGFCDVRNNQGRGTCKCYQPKPKAEATNTKQDLDYSGYHKNLIQ